MTTAQRLIIPEVNVPVRDFAIYLVNETSQPFPASGSLIRGFFYRYQLA